MEASPDWISISEDLIKDPDNFSKWEELVKVAEGGANPSKSTSRRSKLTKLSSADEINLLKETYRAFLLKFPYCHNYWINYANWEFKLGRPEMAADIFRSALVELPHSLEIWLNYLQLVLLTNSNVEEIRFIFEAARSKIGYHFHGHEFYDLYLDFLLTNGLLKNYYVLLRVVIEIPLYHYAKYFALLMNHLEDEKKRLGDGDGVDGLPDVLRYIIPAKEGAAFGLKGPHINQNKMVSKLKKILTDIYITTQYKVYELYQFESKILKSYFDVSFILSQELSNWEEYLEFIELKNYPTLYIKICYERCLVVTAMYPKFWIKYCDYFINNGKKIENAKQTLIKGIQFTPMTNNYQLKLKLIDLEMFQGNFLRARDIILNNLRISSEFLPFICKLISIERLLKPNDDDYLLELFKKFVLLKQVNVNGILFKELLNYNTNTIKLREFFQLFKDSETSLVFWDSYMQVESSSRLKGGDNESENIFELGKSKIYQDLDRTRFINKWGSADEIVSISSYANLDDYK